METDMKDISMRLSLFAVSAYFLFISGLQFWEGRSSVYAVISLVMSILLFCIAIPAQDNMEAFTEVQNMPQALAARRIAYGRQYSYAPMLDIVAVLCLLALAVYYLGWVIVLCALVLMSAVTYVLCFLFDKGAYVDAGVNTDHE